MAERERAPRQLRPAGEAMQHGREGPLPAFLLEDARRVVVGLTRMDHQRQPGHARRRDMGAEAFGLRHAWRVVVVIVESRLADCHDLWMLRACDQVVSRDVELLVRVMRMGADRAGHIGKPLRDGQHLRVPSHAG